MPSVKACVKESLGKVSLARIDIPDPGPGQALVRTTLTTICGSDVHIVEDFPEIPAGMPMGHEAVGVVEAVGAGVRRFAPGDRVVSSCLMSCGACARCRHGEPQICSTFGAPMNLLFGAQSEAFLVSAADFSMTKIPPGVDDRQALFTADVLSTGFGAVERAHVGKGHSVAVFAQGPVGLCVTIAAKHYGAAPLIVVEGLPARQAMARRFGADEVVNPANAVEQILRMTGGAGVDVAIEALGKEETLASCCRVTRLGGTVSSVGVYSGIASLPLATDGSFIHRTFVTTLCPAGSERLDGLLALLAAGKIDPTPMLTHTRPLDEIVAAYDLFRSRADGVIKIAIT